MATQKTEVVLENATPAECRLSSYSFKDTILEKTVHFHVIKMLDSFMVWIGSEVTTIDSLAVAMDTVVDQEPSAVSLLGSQTDVLCTSLAKKLAKNTGKQIFVSYNFSDDASLMALIEKRLVQEMKDCPDKFSQ